MKDFKRRIKTMCKPAFIALCDSAGLTDADKALLVPFYYEQKSEDYIADSVGMSKSAYQVRKKVLLVRLLNYYNFISKF